MSKRKEHIFIDGVEYKHCSKCGEYKPLNEFVISNSNWDKLQRTCKKCRRIYSHSEQRKQYDKQYRAEHREERLEYYKQYYTEHAVYFKQYYDTLEGYAYQIRRTNLRNDRKYGRCGADEDILPPIEYYVWALQQPDFYDGKQYPFTEMGLDRIYNDKPHTFANVIPCSTANNKRRGRKSFEEFKELMKREQEELELTLR